VTIRATDGRAGITAVVIEDKLNLDLVAFQEHMTRHLPEYARPLFLRERAELENHGHL
jgi:fatty-acyl-CoA synthase